MKKIIGIISLILLAGLSYSQGTFTPIQWGMFPGDFSYEENPHPKKVVQARLLGDHQDDIDMDIVDVEYYWDLIRDEHLLLSYDSNPGTYYDLEEDGSGSFGASFKVCYDVEQLYVLFRFTDEHSKADDETKMVEICFQTRYKERYEPGFQQATTTLEKNEQYGRFTELGGSKNAANLGDGQFVEWNVASQGKTGSWHNMPGISAPEYRIYKDAAGTYWGMAAFDFSEHMFYLEDEWGSEADMSNRVPFDPQVKDTISFDLFVTWQEDGQRFKQYWNSTSYEIYRDNYYAGYLVFTDISALGPYVPEDHYYYCPGQETVPIAAEGTNLKWYTDTAQGVFMTEPPVPDSYETGTRKYFITQTNSGGYESGYTEVSVTVYDLFSETPDQTIPCSDNVPMQAVVLNNLQAEELTCTWKKLDTGGEWQGSEVTIPVSSNDGNMAVELSATSPAGCSVTDTVFVQFTPTTDSYHLVKADYDVSGSHYELIADTRNDLPVDSLAFTKSKDGSAYSVLASYPVNGDASISHIDSEVHSSEVFYSLRVLDRCGNWVQPGESEFIHRPVVPDTTWMNSVIYSMSWPDYEGRLVRRYRLHREIDGSTGTVLEEGGSLHHAYLFQHATDTVSYRVETLFADTYSQSDWNRAYSKPVLLPPSGADTRVDTIFIYDTIQVVLHDTIRVYENQTLSDSMVIDLAFSGTDPVQVQQLLVYPNPARTFITIRLIDQNLIQGGRLRIVDMQGITLYENVMDRMEFSIDVNTFGQPGIYLLQIFDEADQLLITRKLILQ